MTIYKDQAPAGVLLLKQEADKTTEALPKQRLGWAAFRAARVGATRWSERNVRRSWKLNHHMLSRFSSAKYKRLSEGRQNWNGALDRFGHHPSDTDLRGSMAGAP